MTLVAGSAEAETLVLTEPLSFWGGLDSATGRIIDQWHPEKNEVMSGRILVMRAGRGSSSGSSVLAEALRRGTGPAGIVLLARDAIVTVGAMVAAELYGRACPVVLASEADWTTITGAGSLAIDARNEAATIEI
ncbi:hypothetical protein USDA257_c53540 [Sinorhizobium fredii USDA 257]|uniref:Phosphomevalonate dehydratase small subunit-like domain-containing protein n=2 Tax=Sinorhizobium/Ensifer group TaxID=227292 RepID=I3XDC2_SINF2|nr:hypothetical protein USDA257_c53540 [Sinorhizobium fredii USDA 257]